MEATFRATLNAYMAQLETIFQDKTVDKLLALTTEDFVVVIGPEAAAKASGLTPGFKADKTSWRARMEELFPAVTKVNFEISKTALDVSARTAAVWNHRYMTMANGKVMDFETTTWLTFTADGDKVKEHVEFLDFQSHDLVVKEQLANLGSA